MSRKSKKSKVVSTSGDPWMDPFTTAMSHQFGQPGSPKAAERYFRHGVMAGHGYCQFAVASWLWDGDAEAGIRKDRRRAVALLTLAARTCPLAMTELGHHVERRDPSTAVALYRRAVRFGSIEARMDLARCYKFGIGVNANPRLASRWRRAGEALGAYIDKRGDSAIALADVELPSLDAVIDQALRATGGATRRQTATATDRPGARRATTRSKRTPASRRPARR